MNTSPTRYVFRFIHCRRGNWWTVQDTQTGRTFGRFVSEANAVSAALAATMAASRKGKAEEQGAL